MLPDVDGASFGSQKVAEQMPVRDIPLARVRPGTFLLLGDDVLLDSRLATHEFCEPAEVIAVHRRQEPDERPFVRDGGIIIRAAGWEDRGDRWIILEMARREGGRVLVCFADDWHLVPPVRVWIPAAHAKLLAERDNRCARWLVTDPVTGHRHDGRDLSGYRIASFWRDASVVWHALPARWFVKQGWLRELLVFEAIGGLRRPAPADIRASETRIHEDVTIGLATLCWQDATLLDYGEDGTLDPVFGPVTKRLVEAFGSPEALRASAIALVDDQLAHSGAEPGYLDRFRVERDKVCRKVARQPRVGARRDR